MNRLSKKMLCLLATLLAVAIGVSVLLNARMVEPVYLYLQRHKLERICRGADAEALSNEAFAQSAEQQDVVVVRVADHGDVEEINSGLYAAFLSRGISLERYWLWEEDYQSAVQQGSQQRIYSQGKLNYSLLVQYLSREGELLAVTMVIPNIASTVSVVNVLSVLFFGGVSLVLLFLVWRVSRKLEVSQSNLERKHQQMEDLLQAVSHDLKTPIALVQAYAAGMQDGLDDGSFLNTIVAQGRSMEQMVEQLLARSRSAEGVLLPEAIPLASLLQERLAAHALGMQQAGITLQTAIDYPATIQADRAALCSILDNLLSNAVKYTADHTIKVALQAQGDGWRLTVQNGLASDCDLAVDRLWEPYYVGENSRNKALSGSGLGLAIVRAACVRLGYLCGCTLADGQLLLWVEG